ncbi:MAG: hypothetical protein ABEK12_01815, partial [Candidatus Nanohaloarchaea archaeon]
GRKSITVGIRSADGAVHTTKSVEFAVERRPLLRRTASSTFTGITSRTTVTVRNRGNVPSNGTTLVARVPSYLSYVTSTTPTPDTVAAEAGSTVYRWNVGTVEPGASATASYTINYWVPVVLLVLLFGAAGLGIRQYRRPHIVKRVYDRDGTHAVHLRVENRSGSVLEDVTVRDEVPGIASLVQKFDAVSPDRIREGGEETGIEWNFNRFEPGEERILTYEVSPQVAVEEAVTLPRASLEYTVDGEERERRSGAADAAFT